MLCTQTEHNKFELLKFIILIKTKGEKKTSSSEHTIADTLKNPLNNFDI